MKIKSFLMVTLLVLFSAQAEEKISYFKSGQEIPPDRFVLLALQSGDYRSFKLCNADLYRAGTLVHTNLEHCSSVGKPGYKYLNSSIVQYRNNAFEEAKAAANLSEVGSEVKWLAIVIPAARLFYQYLGLDSFGKAVTKNSVWLITGALVATISGYFTSVQDSILDDRNAMIKALKPVDRPIPNGAVMTVPMRIEEYSALLNKALIKLEEEGLIEGQSF